METGSRFILYVVVEMSCRFRRLTCRRQEPYGLGIVLVGQGNMRGQRGENSGVVRGSQALSPAVAGVAEGGGGWTMWSTWHLGWLRCVTMSAYVGGESYEEKSETQETDKNTRRYGAPPTIIEKIKKN